MGRYPTEDPASEVPVIDGMVIPHTLVTTTLSSPKLKVKTDSKEHLDITGASISTKGYDLGTFTLEFEAWSVAGRDTLFALAKLLTPKISQEVDKKLAAGVTAHTIRHPSLESIGISQFFVEEISPPLYRRNTRKYTMTLSCKQWAAPPKSTKKPDTSTTQMAPRERTLGGPEVPSKPPPSKETQKPSGLTRTGYKPKQWPPAK